jgi:hypothetical protein
MHGLVALDKEDLSDKEFLEFVCNLQKCNLAKIFETNNLQKYVDLVFSAQYGTIRTSRRLPPKFFPTLVPLDA